MRASVYQRPIDQLLAACDVQVGGTRPWDLAVHHEGFYPRVVRHGSLGLGEAYMDGWWDSPALDQFLFRLLQARIDERVAGGEELWHGVRAWMLNLQTPRRALEVGRRHYDLGNDLYAAMLGRRLVYSCAYWRDAADLDEAQDAKLELVCRKLMLRPGQRVLDIGCGWGEALEYAARRYGVHGVGITVSTEQAHHARERCRGLPIEIREHDYRQLDPGERFDRVYSIGMFEHVGHKNYRRYFELARRCLVDDGLSLLHTIGAERSTNHTDPWISRYIFPNSMLPSAAQVTQALEGLFVIEDWHNFGADYDRTLMAWRRNVDAAWSRLPARYDERFRRMWRYYLAASAAGFRARRHQLWQLVLSPRGVRGGYTAVR
jgi:cyclopropane-fatty-acyl-phospholipid synthase